jgi:integrase/DNA-binding response OmpR family regulator
MTSATNVLLVETDELELRKRTEHLLMDGYAVDAVSDIDQARVKLSVGPDALVLSSEPETIGLLRELRGGEIPRADSRLPVLVLGVDDDSAAVRYYRAGADVALPSESSGLLVAAGLEALSRRAGPPETRVLRVGSLTVDRDARTAQVASRPLKLTRLEFDLLSVASRGSQGSDVGADGPPGGRADLRAPHAGAHGALRAVGRRATRRRTGLDRPAAAGGLPGARARPAVFARRARASAGVAGRDAVAGQGAGIESFATSACYLRGELIQRGTRRLPRFYDEHVAAQFDDPANRARLTDPVARIAFMVMRHAGLRISSACSLKLDCVVVDPGGQPWLRYLDHKGDDEDLVPVGAEIAEEIRAQAARVRERLPGTPWLLPAERANRDGRKHQCDTEIRRRLGRWVRGCDIREQTGEPIEFKPHRFRHTIATELINRGVSKAGIQRFLSHQSGAMTDVYAHMLDETLKQEWLQTKERVNAAGERVALTTPLVDNDAAWLKHQLARAKQTLPDGECGLPIQQRCPHPSACHSCPLFLTDERYRPVLEEQLARAEQRVAGAEHDGHERLAEINRPDVLDLRRIIAGLDRLRDDGPPAT